MLSKLSFTATAAVTILAVVLTTNGCYFKRFELKEYQPILSGKGGSGEIVLAKPVVTLQKPKNDKGQYILAHMLKNPIPIKNDIGSWVEGALVQELTEVGYMVQTGTSINFTYYGI